MHSSARRHFERLLRESEHTPIEAGCLIKIDLIVDKTRDGRIMKRLSKLLVELHRGSQRAA
jgi:hypothetical protein